jgi:hypothetical protein
MRAASCHPTGTSVAAADKIAAGERRRAPDLTRRYHHYRSVDRIAVTAGCVRGRDTRGGGGDRYGCPGSRRETLRRCWLTTRVT